MENELQVEYRRRNRSFSMDYFYEPGTPRTRLEREAGISLSLGHSGLDDLVQGSVLSMIDRVLPNGALAESFGEIGGGYRYDGVFCRSVGEYVWPMCAFGRPDLAEKALRFMLEHVPWGQAYVPHTFHFDGRIYMNVMQVDSIGHAFYGVYHLWLFTGDLSLFTQYKYFFDTWLQSLTWLLLPEYNLVHSGNSNENVDGSSETMCELFTNATVLYGCRSLAVLMDAVGDGKRARLCRDLADRIYHGIDTHLKSGTPVIYRVGFWVDENRKPRPVPENYFKWLNAYSLRFVPDGDGSALAATYAELVRRTAGDFGRYRITLGYQPPNYELLGKFAGWTLGYTALAGRMNELEALLNFVSEYTRKPRDLWPECWLLKADWLDRTDPHRDMPWVNFTNDPDGDYTMDSGNCEQLVLSMEHLVRHVLGVDLRNGKPGIHPALPIGWGEVKVDGLLLPDGTGRASRIGYRYRAVDTGAVLKLNSLPDGELEVSVPAPNDRSYRIYLDGRQIKALRTEPGIEVDRAVCAVRNQTSLKLEITYGNH